MLSRDASFTLSLQCIAREALSLLSSFIECHTAVFVCGVPYLLYTAPIDTWLESQDRIGPVLHGMPRSVSQVLQRVRLVADDFTVPCDAERALQLHGSVVAVKFPLGELRNEGKHPEFTFLSEPGYRRSLANTDQWPVLGIVSDVEVNYEGQLVMATCAFEEASISDRYIYDMTELEFLALRGRVVEDERAYDESVREASRQEEAALQDAAAASVAQDAADDADARREAAAAGVVNAGHVVATRTSRRTGPTAARGALAPLAQTVAFNAAAAEQCALCFFPRAQCSKLGPKQCCKRLVCAACSDAMYRQRRGDSAPAAVNALRCCEKK